MKKAFSAAFLSLALLTACLPFGTARARAADSAYTVAMHGSKTYLGLSSDWGKKWDESNFEDVTDDPVECPGSLTVKAGSVESVDADGDRLTVSGGTVGDVRCSGSVTVTGGAVKSVRAGDDVRVTKVDIRRDVVSDSGDVTLSGTLRVGGDVSAGGNVSFGSGKVTVAGSVDAAQVTFGTGTTVSVSGPVKASETVRLNSCTLSADGIDGDDTGTLEIDGYKNPLPDLQNFEEIVVEAGTKALTDRRITAGSLRIENNAEFTSYDPLELDRVEGPGVLCVDSGELTLHDEVSGSPRLVFNDDAGNGDIAFRADGGAVSETSFLVFGYDLEESSSGGTEVFRLALPGSDGLTLSRSSAAVAPGQPAAVTATVRPKLSDYASDTKIVWELHGDAAAFSKSSSGASCTVSASSQSSGQHRAVLVAYLADRYGDPLEGYRSDSCVLTTGASANGSVRLDTSVVSVLVGDRYGVLAVTDSATMPAAVSDSPSVASVSAGRSVRSSGGEAAWFYTVSGVSAGSTTVRIAGLPMAVKVNSGVMVDTMSYTMAPGARYCIGLLKKGLAENQMSVVSTDASRVSVEKYREGADGVCLYRITAKKAGAADVIFQVIGGESIRTRVTVANGARAGGRSARLVALKTS